MDTSTTGRTVSASDANPLVERPWWQLGIVGGIAAALLNLVVYWLAVGAADVNLQVSTAPGSDELQDLAIPPRLIASFLPGLLAAGLAALLAARTAAPLVRRDRGGAAGALVLLDLPPRHLERGDDHPAHHAHGSRHRDRGGVAPAPHGRGGRRPALNRRTVARGRGGRFIPPRLLGGRLEPPLPWRRPYDSASSIGCSNDRLTAWR